MFVEKEITKVSHMGVSKNKGTPKWMVKIMENPIKMDDLGGKTPIFGNIHIYPPKSEDLNPLVTLSKKRPSPCFLVGEASVAFGCCATVKRRLLGG